ncbi:unnamed protein product [Owenia fusiformis]|uniref:VOC domain-containing protein n=1 Tax=Owenia fusiformis TaxID=6347 RepID=A0A8S4NSH0_OWEFU|nr:unnamed protein product [Owenia fusiformis]
MAAQHLHHVEIGVKNLDLSLKAFTEQFQFELIATRETKASKQCVLKAGSSIVVLTDLMKNHKINFTKNADDASGVIIDDFIYDWSSHFHQVTSDNNRVAIDSVFNVALEVKNIDKCIANVTQNGGVVLQPNKSISDSNGRIKYAIIKSCIGNVTHTLLETKDYSGVFLPGFDIEHPFDNSERKSNLITHVDHVACVVPIGCSNAVQDWYERCFKMKRFVVNSEEDILDGYVIKDMGVGMKLMALEYWKCSEVGLQSQHEDGLKLVLAEPLPGEGTNQLTTFLEEHGGPGVQHIGFLTNDITGTVSVLQKRGVDFLHPPHTYYSEIGKLDEMLSVGADVKALEELGILLDSEADAENDKQKARYLLQKFTKPIFDRNTFFLEILQRCGATGFGAGNISALWRAVQAFLSENKLAENKQ